MNQEKIGKLIRDIRKKNKMSQQQFAEKYGVTYQAVSKWENGKCLPDPSLYNPLCALLNISLTELFNGERITKEEALEKSDQVLSEVIQAQKIDKILDMVSSGFILIAVILLFLSALHDFSQLTSIILITIGILLSVLGLSFKLSIWQRTHHKKSNMMALGLQVL